MFIQVFIIGLCYYSVIFGKLIGGILDNIRNEKIKGVLHALCTYSNLRGLFLAIS